MTEQEELDVLIDEVAIEFLEQGIEQIKELERQKDDNSKS